MATINGSAALFNYRLVTYLLYRYAPFVQPYPIERVELAETGSFVVAARRLRLPTATVSEHVAALEKSLGLQLVIRTTRSNRLTEAGQVVAQGAARILAAAAETLAGVEAQHR